MPNRARSRRFAAPTIALLLMFAVLALPSSAIAERTIALSTGTFELALAPNQSAADRVLVANNGDESLNALVYTANVEIDEEGNQTYTRPSPTPEDYLSSPASWVRIQVPDSTKIVANTPYLEMDPNDEFPVDFELVVPTGASPGDYNVVIFFEMFEFDEGSEGAVSRVSGRIGARIDLRVVGDIVDDMRVQDLTARGFVIGDTTPFSVRVRNEGNIDKTFDLRLVLVGAGENEVWSKTLDQGAYVYAKRDRLYDGAVTFDGVGLGNYELRAIMDYDLEVGDGQGTVLPETITVERGIWVIPLWLAILVIIVVGVPLVYLTYRVTTRGARRGPDDDDAPRSRTQKASRRSRRRQDDEAEERRRAREARRSGYNTEDTGASRPSRDQESAAPSGEGQGELWAPESLFGDDE